MNKFRVGMLVVTGLLLAGTAQASQGLFGGRQPQDGSINLRTSTTEQFDPIRGQSVADRPRPDFDPTPINVGSFQLFPAIDVGAYYDSNIYARQTGKSSDAVVKVDPSVSLASNWGRHAVVLTGLGDFNMYTDHDTEDFNGGAVQAEGRYDIEAATWLAGNAGYQRVTEPRSSPSVAGNAAEPTQYDLFTAGAQLYRGRGRLQAALNYNTSYRDYDSLALIGGGVADQSARNRVGNGVGTRVSYDLTENLKPFVTAGYDRRQYTNNSVRSSNGYNVDVGARMDLGGIITGEAYVGYIGRDYEFNSNSQVNAADFGFNGLWNVTELTSIQLEASRSIEETTLGGLDAPGASSSFIATGGSLTATHELRRNVLIEANLSYTENDFQRSPRNDDNYGAGMGGRYFISRNLYTDLTYDFSYRDSNTANQSYTRHVGLVRIGAQY